MIMKKKMKIVKNKQTNKQRRKQVFVSPWTNHKTSVDRSLKNYQ